MHSTPTGRTESVPLWLVSVGLLPSLQNPLIRIRWGRKKQRREEEEIPVGRAMFLVGVVRLGPQEGDRFPGRVWNIKGIAPISMASSGDQD